MPPPRPRNRESVGESVKQPNRKTRRTVGQTFGALMKTLAKWDQVQVNRIICVDMTGDFIAGYVLSRLIYWHGDAEKTGDPRMKIEREGHLWMARSYEQWFLECRLTKSQIMRVYNILENLGLIETRTWKFAGDTVVHVRIIHDAFMLAWDAAVDAPPPADALELRARHEDAYKLLNAKNPRKRKPPKEEEGEDTDEENTPKSSDKKSLPKVGSSDKKSLPGVTKGNAEKSPNVTARSAKKSPPLTPGTAPATASDTTPTTEERDEFDDAFADGAGDELPKTSKPKRPKLRFKAEPAPIPANEILPGLAAQPVEEEPGDGDEFLRRLIALEGQKALQPVIKSTTALIGLSWPEIAGQLLEFIPEASMDQAELIERLNQDFQSAGLDEQVQKPRAVREVEKKASAVAWHLATFRARNEHPGGIHSLTSRFLTRLADDESLTPADLTRLLAPLSAKYRSQAAANQTEAQRAAIDAQERANQAAAADVTNREAKLWEIACDMVLARMDADEREDYQREATADVPMILLERLNLDPDNADKKAAVERAKVEGLRAILGIEKKHEIAQLVQELRDQDQRQQRAA
jgi:hypothetical protein